MNVSNRRIGFLSAFVLLLSILVTDCHYFPEFSEEMSNVSVVLGHDALLSCRVLHLGGYRLGWIKADTKAIQAIHTHVITHNPRVSVYHDEATLWQLKITAVRREDEGFYMCQINTDPMKNQVAYLRVVVPASIEVAEHGNEVMVSEGGNIRLGCKATGVPQPVVRWHREDGENIIMRNSSGQRHQYQTYESDILPLTKVNRLDMGVYVCTAYNGIPPATSTRIMVNVNFHPFIHVPNQLVWASVNDTCTMECFVEASPRSINYWIKMEGEIVISGDRYLISEIRNSAFATRMTLTIRSFRKSDVGKYRCVAKNSIGQIDGLINVYEAKAAVTQTTRSALMDYIDYVGSEEVRLNKLPISVTHELPTTRTLENESQLFLSVPPVTSGNPSWTNALVHRQSVFILIFVLLCTHL